MHSPRRRPASTSSSLPRQAGGFAPHGWLQVGRFIAVGLLNTAVGYGIYTLGILLDLHYSVANLTALLISIAFSFRTQSRLVFGHGDNRPLPRFLGCWAFLYLINTALIGGMISTGITALVAGGLALGPMAVASFMLQKYFVFRKLK